MIEGYSSGAEFDPGPVDASVEIDGQVIALGEPYRTDAGSQRIERSFRAVHDGLLVSAYLQDYRQGERRLTVQVENGWLNHATGTKLYQAVVGLGDKTQSFDIDQPRNTGWVAELSEGDFATAYQDVDYLKSSGLVPNYAISPEATPGGYVEYAPGENGNHTAKMGNTGYQAQIGLLPKWEANYFASPSPEAYRSIMANSKAIKSYRIAWRDIDTLDYIDIAKFPKWTVSGYNGGGSNQVCANGLCWEKAHFPSSGYSAYLLTGEQIYLDTLKAQATLCYLMQMWNYGGGLGTERLIIAQPRGQAWCWRSIGQYLALSEDESLSSLLSHNMEHFLIEIRKNEIGISNYRSSAYGRGVIAPWQHNFKTQALGFLADIEPLEDMTPLVDLRDESFKWVVGSLGENYCRAGLYKTRVGPSDAVSVDDFWDDFSLISPGETCTDLGNPKSVNYWANLLPALSYAVDAGKADDAWETVSSAPSFNGWISSFNSNAVWGVYPRNK